MQFNAIALLLVSALQSSSALIVSEHPTFKRFPSSISCPDGHGRTVFITDDELCAGFQHNVRQASGTISEFFATSHARGLAVSMEVAIDVGQGVGGQDLVVYNSGTAHTKDARLLQESPFAATDICRANVSLVETQSLTRACLYAAA